MSPPVNVYCCVEVSVHLEPTFATERPLSQGEIFFNSATSRAGLRSWQPLVKLLDFLACLLCDILENGQEVGKAQVVNLPAPQLLHGFDVQLLKAHNVIFFAQVVGKSPVVVSPLIGNMPMHFGKM